MLSIFVHGNQFFTCKLQSWTLVSGHLSNMAKGAFSRTCRKVLIFDLLDQRVTINDIL